MPKKTKYKGIKKSRSNTSGKASTAKREAEKKAVDAKRKKAGKAIVAPKKSKAKRVAKGLPFKRSSLNPQNPKQLPESSQTRKGLTLRKLIRGTPRLMINNAHDVEVLTIAKQKTRSGMPAIHAVTLTNDPWRPNRLKKPHDTFIIGLDKLSDGSPDTKTPINKHKRVIVSCACENYVFQWEYANATYGASRILYGNCSAPNFTNPGLAPGMCKHLVSLALKVIKEGK